jgi:hypothetical protein
METLAPTQETCKGEILPSGIDHPKCQFWGFWLCMQDHKAIFDGDTGPNTGGKQRRILPSGIDYPQKSVLCFSVVHAGPQSHI